MSEIDVTLSDGREIVFDMHRLTITEFRALFDRKQAQGEEDETLARVAGLTLEEFRALPYPDWRLLCSRFFEVAQRPLDRPNSVSESTST